MQMQSNVYVVPYLCCFFNLGSPSERSSIRRKTCHAPNIFVGIELLRISIRGRPPNRAKGVAVFGGSPIRYKIAFFSTRAASTAATDTIY